MFTQFITFAVIVAIIGCIMYGRKLIRTEKVDAVFGNPERAKGGTHWIIVGSSVILLTWLYYSWDIAKSFYPQSANELCQVGKVNDSLLSLKYLFPIEEREFKSTSIIKAENKNIAKLKNEIQNSKDISEQHRSFLIGLIDKTKSTIPLLTNESLLENQTKIKISELAGKIDQLSNEFKKEDYPYETSEQRNKRLIDAQAEGGWGASGTAVENTVEVPTIPKTNKGLKFDAAAQELKAISDEFFKLRNHNFQYKSVMKKIKDDVKAFRKAADDSEEVASTLAKDVLKIARRIEYASIFPPKTLNAMQNSILTFDEVQKNEQGSLRLVDILLFPAGTIVSSGPNCSEQGSGRWLPKPSDTLNKFILLSKPSVGFKNIPLLWFEMMDVSKIVGFILPDWIADIIPGKYPVHNEFGVVEPNFKSKVLSVVSGEFSLFKIPIPMGHIWDSFLRVLLGLVIGIILGVPLGLFMGLNRFAKGFFDPLIELYRPVPPLAWAPLIISVLGIDNVGKVFLLFMVSFSIMIISARAGASGTQLSKIHASHSLGASRWQILRYVIFPNSLPEILTGVRVAIGMCWGTLLQLSF
jgi:taurine transport system permease protein